MLPRLKFMFVFGLFLAIGLALTTPAGANPTGGTAATISDWYLQNSLPQGLALSKVECLSDDFCKAVFNGDSIIGWDGAEWVVEYLEPAPAPSLTTLAIGCASENLCKAVGLNGLILSWNGQSWAAETSNTTATLLDISCPSETLCKAVGDLPSILSWNGTTWALENTPSGDIFHSIDCPSTTLCKALDDTAVFNWNGIDWQLEFVQTFADISCPTLTFCQALRDSSPSPAYIWNGTIWMPGLELPLIGGPGFRPQIACTASTNCLALDIQQQPMLPNVGYTSRVWAWDGGQWLQVWSNFGDFSEILQDVACFAPDNCQITAANSTILSWDGETITTQFSPPDEHLRAVACVNESFCKAVGYDGLIQSWNGEEWVRETVPAAQAINEDLLLYTVACPSETVCKAGGDDGRLLTWNGTLWSIEEVSTQLSLTDITVITCPSVTLCKIVASNGSHSYILSWNGTAWVVELSEELVGVTFRHISCPTLTFCLASSNQAMLVWDGQEWVENAITPLAKFDCANATFCKGLDSEHLYNWSGTAWVEDISVVGSHLWDGSIDCTSEIFCQAQAGDKGYSWNGTEWQEQSLLTSSVLGIGCASPAVCFMVGSSGTVLGMASYTLIDVSPDFALDIQVGKECVRPLTITQVNSDHPNATADLLTGRYWSVETEECVTELYGRITLPTTLTPEPADMVCAYNGRLWVCETPVETTANTYTIDGLLPLSDVAIRRPGPNATAYQQFLPLMQR